MSDPVTQPGLELPSVKVFFSYVRADNESFNFIEPLKTSLKQLVSGLSGRPVEIFVDKHDIPLGDNWREKIESAVRQSYFFVPIYTANYVQSTACREEFFQFQEEAERRQVAGLIIPIIWLGLESLMPEGEDIISDYVRHHQAAIFDDAWVEGVDSPPFRRNVLAIARRIISVAEDIDAALATSEEREAGTPDNGLNEDLNRQDLDEVEDSEELDESDGLIELSDVFISDLERMTQDAVELGEAISDLGDLPDIPDDAKASPKAMSKFLIRVADKMKQPSLIIDERGQSLFLAAKRCDGHLRNIIQSARLSGSTQLIAQVYASLSEGVGSLGEIASVGEQLEFLLNSMRTPEALSASIRRAVKPARQGIVAVQDAIVLMSDWPDLIETLNDNVD